MRWQVERREGLFQAQHTACVKHNSGTLEAGMELRVCVSSERGEI